jgi:hypothetical protein
MPPQRAAASHLSAQYSSTAAASRRIGSDNGIPSALSEEDQRACCGLGRQPKSQISSNGTSKGTTPACEIAAATVLPTRACLRISCRFHLHGSRTLNNRTTMSCMAFTLCVQNFLVVTRGA